MAPRCGQAGRQVEARLKYYLLAFIQLECERVTAAVNVQRAAAFRKKKKTGDNSVSATVAGMIGHQRSFPLTDLDKRKL